MDQSPSMVDRGQREDDVETEEEAEVWAALERLPTYDLMRTTILQREQSTRPIRPVRVKDVDLNRYLMTQLFKLNNPEEDNEIFLSRLRKRIDNVGVEIPRVEIRYENLKVQGKVHQGTRGTPTLLNAALNFLESLTSALKLSTVKKNKLTILEGVSGIVRPGRLTLLLGPPSSGKTTFLLALSGQLNPSLKLEGDIEYNGCTLDEFEPKKTAAYISQHDLHLPELTVRETLRYSARFQAADNRYDLIRELFRKERAKGIQSDPQSDFFLKAVANEEIASDLITEYYMKIMGLDICADTIVGDQMRRGISGGQRKRLTTAEMIVGQLRAFFMDEISTGLDSSTAFQVVKCIGQAVQIFESTIVISLVQPAPETYDLFDDLILLSGGHIVYHGALEHVAEFFETCGFKCPPRKAMPEFLQEVTSIKDQGQYWADQSRPYKFVPVVQFVEAYRKFHVWKNMNQDLARPFDKSKSSPSALAPRPWLSPQWELFKITLDKEILLLKKNWILPVFTMSQLSSMSLLGASVFFRTEMHTRNLDDAQNYSGAIFYIVVQVLFLGYIEITLACVRFPVFHKFREIYFFPPWTWALSLFIIKIPFSILESLSVLGITYYLMGFTPQAARFFRLWLLLALGCQMTSGLFRMVAGFSRSLVVGNTVGGLVLSMIFMLGGYVIPRQSIRNWWIWAYWTTPLSYLENAIINNEFLAPRWRMAVSNSEHTLGHVMILSMDLFDNGYWFWMVCGVLFAYTLAFYFIFAWTITYLGVPGKAGAQLSEEQMFKLHAQRTGEGVDYILKGAPAPRSLSSRVTSGLPGLSIPKVSIERCSQKRSLTNEDSKAINTDGRTTEDDSPSGLQMTGLPEVSHASTSSNENNSENSRSSSIKMTRPNVGMSLPFQPLVISFRDINYFVNITVTNGLPEGKLQLLRGITGSFRPGVLTALIGVTGAGKSTLMDVLAGRKTRGSIEGDIWISGFPKKQETFARVTGYCEQNDIHSPQVTVHESLIFSAWLRLPPEIDNNTKTEFVHQSMDLVDLTALKDAIVGIPGESGLSIEQRKRLTIAVELVANPSIIFMDGPTSGLDAQAAATVMRAVRNTVDTGRTVVCTIQQPSIDIFDSFDELLFLKRGGQMIYAGPLGKNAQKLIEYFQNINGIPKIREGTNPAAWVLECTTPGMEEKLKVDFAEIYKNSSLYEQTNALVEELSKPTPGTEDLSFPNRYAQPMWSQFTCCLWRQFWAYWRTPGYNLMRIILSFATALFAGSLFWGMGRKLSTQRSLCMITGAIHSSQLFSGVLTAMTVQPIIASERLVFYRERSAGMYADLPYAIAQCMVEVPYMLGTSATYSLISFAMIKLSWTAKKFFWWFYFSFCSQMAFVYLGLMTVAISPSLEVACIFSGLCYNLWNLYSGFYISRLSFPQWWKWAYWCDPLSYHIYGAVVSQFGDLDDIYATSRSGMQYSVREMLRIFYGYKHEFLWFVGSMSILLPIVFALLFVVSIKYLNYQER